MINQYIEIVQKYSNEVRVISKDEVDNQNIQIINFAVKVNSDEEYVYAQIDFEPNSIFKFEYDGWYKIIHFVMPTDTECQYYYKEGKVYKGNYEISYEELLELNNAVSGIYRCERDVFAMFNLMTCYYNLCASLIPDLCGECSNGIVSDDWKVLYSIIQTIKLLIQAGDYQKAQKLLEQTITCNGICQQYTKTKKGYDCGCNKQA